jgi:hypothetical protein
MHELAALPLWVNDAKKEAVQIMWKGVFVFTHYVARSLATL